MEGSGVCGKLGGVKFRRTLGGCGCHDTKTLGARHMTFLRGMCVDHWNHTMECSCTWNDHLAQRTACSGQDQAAVTSTCRFASCARTCHDAKAITGEADDPIMHDPRDKCMGARLSESRKSMLLTPLVSADIKPCVLVSSCPRCPGHLLPTCTTQCLIAECTFYLVD